MAYLNSRPRAPKVCPVCGEDVPPKALACPECGADHNTGWKEDAGIYDGVDLGEDEFDYEEFTRREFGSGSLPKDIKPLWWIVAVLLLAAFILMAIRGG